MSSSLQQPLLDQLGNPTNLESEPNNRSTEPITSSFSSSGKTLNGATATEELTSGIELSRQSSEPRTSVEGLLNGKRISRGVHWLDDSMALNASESFSSSSASVQPDSGNPMALNSSENSSSSSATVQPDSGDESTNWTPKIRDKYEESALYIREGEDDAKFYHHPENKWAKRVYVVLHYQAYYMIHFITCILLLLLVFAETPSVGQQELDVKEKKILVSIHGVLEIIFLTLLGVNVVLHLVWFRSNFVRHRIMIITIILAVMYAEALTVIISQQNHIRITRILRPFFLLDTHYMGGVRRVTRQIVQIMKPILDVLLLLIFFILLFGLFGYLFFAETDPDYFSNFSRSCLSLFITTSTANSPDVMMESYATHRATPIFYVIYLIVTLYFASNVLLAVVYASFSEADKKKFKKLFIHKRDALLQAFHVLSEDPSSDELPNRQVQFQDFLLMMQHYRPRMPEWQVFCIFKSLNDNPHNQYKWVNEEDFLRFYEVLDFRWTRVNHVWDKLKWYSQFSPRVAKPLEFIDKVVSHRIYKFLMGVVVLVNFIFLMVVANRINDATERYEEFHKVLPGTFVFLSIYILDITFTMLGHGPYEHFRKFWNVADVIVIIISLISAIVNIYYITWAVFLPLKLIRLIRLKRRYRDMMNTMIDLVPRLLSVLVLILIIYYCFAIIGMEFLNGKVEQGCCTDALYSVGDYYKDNSSVTSQNVYYLINFDNILYSYATLFMLMVVNNWYIIMEGFASEVHPHTIWLTRIYFMMFDFITLVVLQVAIAFIVEAFVLKIQAAIKRRVCMKHPNSNCGCPRQEERKKKVIITLVEEDLAKLQHEISYMDNHYKGAQKWLNKRIRTWKRNHFKIADRTEVYLVGSRSRTKEDIHLLHYKDEIQTWRREKPTNIRRRSNFELDKWKKLKDKRNIRQLCSKLGVSILDFIMD